MRTDLGVWLTKHSECLEALRDGRFSSALERDQPSLRTRSNLLFMDPPSHTTLRRAVIDSLPQPDEAFSNFVSTTCDHLLQPLGREAEIDVVSQFAQPLAANVVTHLLGLPRRCAAEVGRFLETVRPLTDPRATTVELIRAQDAGPRLMRLFARAIREVPSPGALSGLMANAQPPSGVSRLAWVCSVAVMLAHASYENTANGIGSVARLALHNHDLRDELIAGDNDGLVDELLRMASPAHVTMRRATVGLDLNRGHISAGELVCVVLGAANRDPDQFQTPDHATLGRRGTNLAFGYGRHSCVGASFARIEMHTSLRQLFRQFPSARQSGDEDWRSHIAMRGLRSLIIT